MAHGRVNLPWRRQKLPCFAHIWPTSRPRTWGRLALPVRGSRAGLPRHGCVLIHPSMLHHEHHPPDRADVVEGIAIHGYYIRFLPLRQRTDPVRHPPATPQRPQGAPATNPPPPPPPP